MNLDPLVTISKKVLADSVVLKQGSASSSTVPKGYLVAYEQNSASFKADAKLFDTWVRAIALTDSVLENGPAGNWVKSSAERQFAKNEGRLDPWQHPFCLLRRADVVLAISAGANAPGSPLCQDIDLSAKELAEFPQKKLLESPSGSLVLVRTKDSSVSEAAHLIR